jgi:hypothetical protein
MLFKNCSDRITIDSWRDINNKTHYPTPWDVSMITAVILVVKQMTTYRGIIPYNAYCSRSVSFKDSVFWNGVKERRLAKATLKISGSNRTFLED